MRFRIEACRSCGAAVVWARMAGGKLSPVNAAPVPEGNIVLSGTGARVPDAAVVDPATAAGAELRTSHFATCPHAPEWRKPR